MSSPLLSRACGRSQNSQRFRYLRDRFFNTKTTKRAKSTKGTIGEAVVDHPGALSAPVKLEPASDGYPLGALGCLRGLRVKTTISPTPGRQTSCLGTVAFLVPGVKAHLSAIKPEFDLSASDGFVVRLATQRRRLGLTIEEAASRIGVGRWTWGLWEGGGQRPQARYREALGRFLADAH